jgi:3-oxoacyl-[acyl-carrier protein] reductase
MLNGKVALVTGASRGIGRAIALSLAEAGADVVVNYAGSEQAAEEVVQAIRGLGRRSEKVQANVGLSEQVDAMIKFALDTFGQIDILVNNAGITRDNLIMRMKEEEFDEVISINLKGVFNCIKAVSRPMMKQRSGTIINISSVVGVLGNPGQANYVAAKAGVIGLTKSTARELALRTAMLTQIPLSRMGAADEIAKVVRFLASDASSYMTGQTLHVDGGMYM